MLVDVSHDLAGKLGHDVFGNQCGLVKTGVGQNQELQEIGGGQDIMAKACRGHGSVQVICQIEISFQRPGRQGE